jgi:DNA-binding NarL/FixJ family response regulator
MEVDSGRIEALTSRENDVLRLSAEGLNRQDIASQLNISISTVNFHRQNIKQKLQAETLTGMIHTAHAKGLVE